MASPHPFPRLLSSQAMRSAPTAITTTSTSSRDALPLVAPLYRLSGTLLRDLSCAISPATAHVATGDPLGHVSIWDPSGTLLFRARPFSRRVLASRFSRSGTVAVFGSSDCCAVVVSVCGTAGAVEVVFDAGAGEVLAVACNDGGDLVAVGTANGSAQLWGRSVWRGGVKGPSWGPVWKSPKAREPVLDVTVCGTGQCLVRPALCGHVHSRTALLGVSSIS